MAIEGFEKFLQANRAPLRELRALILEKGGVIPFVGAGVSQAMGLPLWRDFLKDGATRNGCLLEVERSLEVDNFEEAGRTLIEAATEPGFDHFLQEQYGDDVWKGHQLSEILELLPEVAKGPVVTTNFDRLLEAAYLNAECPFRSVVHGGEATKTNVKVLREKYHQLLKLHGDWDQPRGRILTLSEYANAYGHEDPRKFDFGLPLPEVACSPKVEPRAMRVGGAKAPANSQYETQTT